MQTVGHVGDFELVGHGGILQVDGDLFVLRRLCAVSNVELGNFLRSSNNHTMVCNASDCCSILKGNTSEHCYRVSNLRRYLGMHLDDILIISQ
jgi:hypothetical protein